MTHVSHQHPQQSSAQVVQTSLHVWYQPRAALTPE